MPYQPNFNFIQKHTTNQPNKQNQLKFPTNKHTHTHTRNQPSKQTNNHPATNQSTIQPPKPNPHQN